MRGHPTIDKGYLGLTKVMANLAESQFSALLPACEQMPFDLVVYKDGVFFRVEVKYRTSTRGSVTVDFRHTSVYASGKTYSKPMDKNEIDVVAIYCPDTDKCYYLDPQDFPSSATLRITPPKNGQATGVHLADSFLKFPLKR